MNSKEVLFLCLYFGLVSSNLSFIVLVDDKTDTITTAVNDAVQSIGNRDKLLNYSSILQTKCQINTALDFIKNELQGNSSSLTMAIIDTGCLLVTEGIIHLCNYLDMPLISASTTSSIFSNHSLYPILYRTVPSDDYIALALVTVIQYYGWSEVTIINQMLDIYNERYVQIFQECNINNVNVNPVMFDQRTDFNKIVKKAFNGQPHIFVVNTGEKESLTILCQAYSKGRYYPNYEWILLDLYPDQWWMEYEEYLDQINCSLSSVTTVLNRALVLLPYPDDVGRILPDRFFQTIDYLQDAITLYTSALNTSLIYYNISKDEVYSRSEFYKRVPIQDILLNTSFFGKTGYVEINRNGNRRSRTTLVLQYQQSSDSLKPISIGRVNINTYILQLNLTIWPDGIPPDGHPVTVISTIQVPVVIFVSILVGVLLIFAIICLCFNIVFRNKKIVKLTSPNLNYIMIVGAIGLIYSAIPLITKSVALKAFKCNSQRLISTLGYDLCFAVIIVKTFRVYYIFKCDSAKKQSLKDWKLALIVFAITAVDLILSVPFIITAIIKGDTAFVKDEYTQSDTNEQEVMQNYFVAVCGNTIYFPLFLITTILYKFVLHIIGLVLIFLTRNVEVDVLNDSKYLPSTIYCSTILLITSCMTLYIVSRIQNVLEITWAIFISIMITIFLGFNYIPKMMALHKDPEGKHVFTTKQSTSVIATN